MSDTNQIFSLGSPLPSDWFTGDAFLFPLVSKDHNNNFTAGSVTFEIGARTNWHTHPKGQVLLVIAGEGIYQEQGGQARKIVKGDVVIIPEDIVHWHGASATTSMTHIAITNFKDDSPVTWLTPVSDDDFSKASSELF